MPAAGPAPGQDSIEAAFAAVYDPASAVRRVVAPGARPPAVGPAVTGVTAYRGEDHWHLVTLGLTDLVAKAPGTQADRSGFGHELTLLTPATDVPPPWAFDLLVGTARVCGAVGRPFHPGARLAPGGPIDGGASALCAVGIREDPFVTPLTLPFGEYRFLQAVGVTDVEYRLMQRAGTLKVLAALAARDPLLRTDPRRGGSG